MRTCSGHNRSANVMTFLRELRQLCAKHDVLLSHEDRGGAFLVEQGFDGEAFDGWLGESWETDDRDDG